MIISEKEIEQSISLNLKDEMNPEIGECFFHYSDENIYSKGFREGVAFAESKIEEMAIEFARYYHKFNGEFSEDNLFKEFLKQRNEKTNR